MRSHFYIHQTSQAYKYTE